MNEWFDQILFGFRFESPWILCALIVLPVWAWLRGRYAPVAAVQYSSAKLLKVAAKKPRFGRGRMLVLMRLSALNFLILALARPQMEQGFTERETMGINIAFVLDFSSTMKTRDFMLERKPVSRVDAMKAVVSEFIRSRPEDRISVVRFDAAAHLISPLTLDHDWLLGQLAFEESGKGTAPGSGMLVAAEALLPAEQQTKVMITVTDADKITEGPSPEEVASVIAPLGIKHHVIQLANLASMQRIADGAAALKGAAQITGGQFFQVSDSAGLHTVYQQIDQLEKSAFKESVHTNYRELMGWFAWPAVLILLVELMFAHWVWRKLP